MTLIEFIVVLGACLIGCLIGALVYERYIRRPDKLIGAALGRAAQRERDRVKSQDQTTAGNRTPGPN